MLCVSRARAINFKSFFEQQRRGLKKSGLSRSRMAIPSRMWRGQRPTLVICWKSFVVSEQVVQVDRLVFTTSSPNRIWANFKPVKEVGGSSWISDWADFGSFFTRLGSGWCRTKRSIIFGQVFRCRGRSNQNNTFMNHYPDRWGRLVRNQLFF